MASLASSRQPPAGKRPRSPSSPAESPANTGTKRQKTTAPTAALPSDFFSPVSSMPPESTTQSSATGEPDLDAEWAAFQAEVVASRPPSPLQPAARAPVATTVTISAPPMRNPPPGEEQEEWEKLVEEDVQGEKEEAQQKLLEEFEEMESLEERVRRLKTRREELKKAAPKAPVMMEFEDRGSLKNGTEQDGEEEDEEKDEEEDEEKDEEEEEDEEDDEEEDDDDDDDFFLRR